MNNNNDILNELQRNGDFLIPSKLDPTAIEKSLSGVKRKSYRNLKKTCISLALVCLTVAGMNASIANKYTLPIKTSKTNVKSYKDIYNIVNSVKKANEETFFDKLSEKLFYSIEDRIYNNFYTITTNSMDALGAVKESVTEDTISTPEYSETNTQVKGVDEADIVKTDGKYIYSVYDKKISIAQANNGTPLNISSIQTESEISDIYIHGNKLVVFSCAYSKVQNNEQSNTNSIMSDVAVDYYRYSPSNLETQVKIYDLSNINSPVLLSELSQSGDYLSSRKIDNVVYITSTYSVSNFDNIKKSEPETYCPVYGTDDNTNCVPAENIFVAEAIESIKYVVVSSIDLNNPNDFSDICSVMGSGTELYSSMNNIYVSANGYSYDDYDTTQILRFSLNGTDIAENGSLKVDGRLLNQFSMDEHNGFFRIVTDDADSGTALYVFDNELNLAGKTENVARDENVKSVRFDGNIAYFVTFRQTDPLFTVDLSDPYSPKILSELKIPGFSEYLHPFGDGLLLGFGREADPYTGISEGLKLTMFNTSDKTNVTELATMIFTDEKSRSIAETDHKAIFVDVERGLIGIPYHTRSYTDDSSANIKNLSHYTVFKYDKEKNCFTVCKDMILNDESNNYYSYESQTRNEYTRGLYIGDYFYIVSPDKIYSLDYNTFEFKSELYTNTNTLPSTEPVTEPCTEPITEPATEPATVPATEPITEPTTEPITELSTEPKTEPATTPTATTPTATVPMQ